MADKNNVKKSKKKVTNEKISKKSKSVPLGVKIISIIGYFNAFLLLMGGIALFFKSEEIFSLLIGSNPGVASGNFTTLAFMFIVLAVIEFFIARGLWNLKNWARVITVILSIIIVVIVIYNIFKSGSLNGIFDLIIYGVIATYLLFYRKAKAVFSN